MKAKNLSFNHIENKIKTIVFDLGGVFFTSGTQLAVLKINERYNIQDRKSLGLFFKSRPNSEGGLLRLGHISMDDFEMALEKVLSKKKVPKNLYS